jgi:hypothetical protein
VLNEEFRLKPGGHRRNEGRGLAGLIGEVHRKKNATESDHVWPSFASPEL